MSENVGEHNYKFSKSNVSNCPSL